MSIFTGHGTNGESQTITDRVEGLVEILNLALAEADWDVGQGAACQRVRVLWQGPPRFQNGTQDSSQSPCSDLEERAGERIKEKFLLGPLLQGLGPVYPGITYSHVKHQISHLECSSRGFVHGARRT